MNKPSGTERIKRPENQESLSLNQALRMKEKWTDPAWKEQMRVKHLGKNSTHGLFAGGKKPKLYSIWQNMGQRCNNPKDQGYKNYGGRGITVCERWSKFENFYADMIESYLEHLKLFPSTNIDRTDNDKGYSPDNCRWVTKKESQANRRPQKPRKTVAQAYAEGFKAGVTEVVNEIPDELPAGALNIETGAEVALLTPLQQHLRNKYGLK